MAGPAYPVAAFAPVHGDELESLGAGSVVGSAFEVAVAVAAAAVPHSVSEVVLEWTSATEHVAIAARIERESAAEVGPGAVAGPEVVPWIESE